MSDGVKSMFRWEDIDRRLVSPKALDLSEEMQKRANVAERRIAHETAQSKNSAGIDPVITRY